MSGPLLLMLFSCGSFLAQTAERVWLQTFDGATGAWPRQVLMQVPGRGGGVHISVAPGTLNPGRTVAMPVPVDAFRGKPVLFGADVKTVNVSRKPNQGSASFEPLDLRRIVYSFC